MVVGQVPPPPVVVVDIFEVVVVILGVVVVTLKVNNETQHEIVSLDKKIAYLL